MKAPVGRDGPYYCEGDHKFSAPAGMRLQMHSLEVCLEPFVHLEYAHFMMEMFVLHE